MILVPLLVRIHLNDKGKHKFPLFNELPSEIRQGMDWSYFVDKFGGWHYDKVAGHSDNDPSNDSPFGVWLGMLLVPEDFALVAIEKFPNQVSTMSLIESEDFYEKRVTIDQSDVLEDVDILQVIAAKRAIGIVEDQQDIDSLNANHPSRGRRQNKTKTWVGYKQQRGITVKSFPSKP